MTSSYQLSRIKVCANQESRLSASLGEGLVCNWCYLLGLTFKDLRDQVLLKKKTNMKKACSVYLLKESTTLFAWIDPFRL